MNKVVFLLLNLVLLFSCGHSKTEFQDKRYIASSTECSILIGRILRDQQVIKENLLIPSTIKKISMHNSYRLEEEGKVFAYPVDYLSVKEREEFQIFFNSKGEIVDQEGKLYGNEFVQETESYYVIGTDGKMYISKSRNEKGFHHSSFLAGGDVVAAGMIEVVRGKIQYIDNSSGHYTPSDHSFSDILDILVNHGVKINQVHLVGEE